MTPFQDQPTRLITLHNTAPSGLLFTVAQFASTWADRSVVLGNFDASGQGRRLRSLIGSFFSDAADNDALTIALYGWAFEDASTLSCELLTTLTATVGSGTGSADAATLTNSLRACDTITKTDGTLLGAIATAFGGAIALSSPANNTIARVVMGDLGNLVAITPIITGGLSGAEVCRGAFRAGV